MEERSFALYFERNLNRSSYDIVTGPPDQVLSERAETAFVEDLEKVFVRWVELHRPPREFIDRLICWLHASTDQTVVRIRDRLLDIIYGATTTTTRPCTRGLYKPPARPDECVLTLEPLTREYMECSTCRACFSAVPMQRWLHRSPHCPCCRTAWHSFVIYNASA